jgi:hypothetical protein
MGMRNPIPTYTYIISELGKRHPDLAYIHLIEPGIESITEGVPQELDQGVTVSCFFQHYEASAVTQITSRLRCRTILLLIYGHLVFI